MTATKLPRRLLRRFDIEAAASEYVRWHGQAGARRVVSELRSFWTRRQQPGRTAAQERILQVIDAMAPAPTLH